MQYHTMYWADYQYSHSFILIPDLLHVSLFIIVLSYHNQNILGKILTNCCEGLKDTEFFEKKPLA